VAGAALVGAALLALTGCSLIGGAQDPERDDSGEIVSSDDDADVFALRVGDCMASTDEATEVQTVPTRPCAEAHDSEIFASTTLPDGDFPGDDAVAATADDYCYGQFQSFVGMAYEDSVLDLRYFMPSKESWDGMTDREVLCIVIDPAGGVTGTMQGANR
jgi:hypothetical protein